MLRRATLMLPLLLFFAGASAMGQETSSRQKALNQMRQIVAAVRACPQEVSALSPKDNFANRRVGPPSVLGWDVVASGSARSPFVGFIRFTIPVRIEETDEAKRSEGLDKKYRNFIEALRSYEEENHVSALAARYQYQFGFGPGGPELRKALILTPLTKRFVAYDPSEETCWDAVARSPESAGKQMGLSAVPAVPLSSGVRQNDEGTTHAPAVPPKAARGSRVVSFAWADSGGVYLGTPGWVNDWVRKHAKNYPEIRFSEEPARGARNFLVVLSSSVAELHGFQPVLQIETEESDTDFSGSGTAIGGGDFWSYDFSGTATTTTTRMRDREVPYTIREKWLYISAYNAAGVMVTRRSQLLGRWQTGGDQGDANGVNGGSVIAGLIGALTDVRGRLLGRVMKDIARGH